MFHLNGKGPIASITCFIVGLVGHKTSQNSQRISNNNGRLICKINEINYN